MPASTEDSENFHITFPEVILSYMLLKTDGHVCKRFCLGFVMICETECAVLGMLEETGRFFM